VHAGAAVEGVGADTEIGGQGEFLDRTSRGDVVGRLGLAVQPLEAGEEIGETDIGRAKRAGVDFRRIAIGIVFVGLGLGRDGGA